MEPRGHPLHSGQRIAALRWTESKGVHSAWFWDACLSFFEERIPLHGSYNVVYEPSDQPDAFPHLKELTFHLWQTHDDKGLSMLDMWFGPSVLSSLSNLFNTVRLSNSWVSCFGSIRVMF